MGFQKFVTFDLICFLVATPIFLVLYVTEHAVGALFIFLGTPLFWSLAHIYRLRKLMDHSFPADAEVVSFTTRSSKFNRRNSAEIITVIFYSPILRYETDTQVIEAAYSIYKQDAWFREHENYRICYCVEKPELFYFPGREMEMTLAYWLVAGVDIFFILSAAYTIIS